MCDQARPGTPDSINPDMVQRLVRAYSARYGKLHTEDENDIQQQLLLKFLNNPDMLMRYDPAKGRLESWLSVIIRNMILDHSRREIRQGFVRGLTTSELEANSTVADETANPEVIAIEKETRERIERALLELESGPRESIVARFVENKRLSQIADEMNISNKLVRQHLIQGHRILVRTLRSDREPTGTVWFTSPNPVTSDSTSG